jgi:iron complex transport system permease protein
MRQRTGFPGGRGILYAALFLLVAAALFLMTGPTGWPDSSSVLTLRILRGVAALLAGITLAVNGAGLQALLVNPLADPYILGIASGSAFGYALGIVAGIRSPSVLSVPAALGGLAAFSLVYMLARRPGELPRGALLLSGVLVSFLFGSLVVILMILKGEAIQRVLYVLWGHLGVTARKSEMGQLIGIGIALLAAVAYMFSLFKELDALSLGESEALAVGVNVERVKRTIFIVTSISTGLLVSVVGAIGFVGLVVPHIARLLVGSRHSTMIPIAALLGAGLMLLSDIVSRVITPFELPVGIITSLIGVPFFFYLLRSRGHEGIRA